MSLFDAHCHLQDDRLFPHLDDAMTRASTAGVTGLMCCGCCEEDWLLLPGIAHRFPQVRLSFGLHPWYVGERSTDWLDALKRNLTTSPSAVGEIGLDHALDKATFADQESVFLAQLHLANELGRPVTIHCRRAWGRLMELLDAKGWPACGFVIHSYSGSSDLVEPLARRGAYFSFSGSIISDRNVHGRAALESVPLDRLLIETDAPDLFPNQNPSIPSTISTEGKPVNEPANLLAVAKTVAKLRGLSLEEVAIITCQNASSLFA